MIKDPSLEYRLCFSAAARHDLQAAGSAIHAATAHQAPAAHF
jgi:hypothetical protein